MKTNSQFIHEHRPPKTVIRSLRKYAVMLGAAMLLASCGEYQKVLKSHDADYRLDFAKRAFEQKKYTQAATVLEDIVTQFKGS